MKFLILLLCFFSLVSKANEPTIKIVVPYSAGGPNDIVAKLIQKSLFETTGKTSVVMYLPGASGEIGAAAVANNKLDETTFLIASANLASSNTEKNVNYNFNNLIPVAYIGHIPLVLVVNKNFPAKTIDGFKQLPKDQIIKYASSGLNTSTHLTGAVFSQNFSNTFVHVPYKGIAQGIPNLLAGITDMAFVPWPIVEPYIKTGQLIPLAVVSLDRLNKFPEVPTFKELGFKNFGFKTWFVLLASPNTNSNSIKIIQDSLVQTLNSNKSQQYTNIGIELDISQILNSKEFLDKEINLYREFYQKNPQFNSNKLK